MTTAKDQYEKRVKEIDDLLTILDVEMKLHKDSFDVKPTNWAMSGDLGYIKDSLETIIDFMSGNNH